MTCSATISTSFTMPAATDVCSEPRTRFATVHGSATRTPVTVYPKCRYRPYLFTRAHEVSTTAQPVGATGANHVAFAQRCWRRRDSTRRRWCARTAKARAKMAQRRRYYAAYADVAPTRVCFCRQPPSAARSQRAAMPRRHDTAKRRRP